MSDVVLVQLNKAWEADLRNDYPDPHRLGRGLGFSLYDSQVFYDEDSGLDKQQIVVLEHLSSGRLFMVSAEYSSWSDTSWSDTEFEEVVAKEVKVTRYVPIKESK